MCYKKNIHCADKYWISRVLWLNRRKPLAEELLSVSASSFGCHRNTLIRIEENLVYLDQKKTELNSLASFLLPLKWPGFCRFIWWFPSVTSVHLIWTDMADRPWWPSLWWGRPEPIRQLPVDHHFSTCISLQISNSMEISLHSPEQAVRRGWGAAETAWCCAVGCWRDCWGGSRKAFSVCSVHLKRASCLYSHWQCWDENLDCFFQKPIKVITGYAALLCFVFFEA